MITFPAYVPDARLWAYLSANVEHRVLATEAFAGIAASPIPSDPVAYLTMLDARVAALDALAASIIYGSGLTPGGGGGAQSSP